MLHELVAGHAQTLLAELRDADPEGGGLPRYVERELAAYLRCGILAHGFARVRCQTCHDEIVVAFSCKRRGICPSCTARRMADTAAHLADRVLPRAPYRQWVFTVPKPLRLVLARDPAWTSWIGGLVVRAIGAWQRHVARKRGLRAPLTGAVTFVQRFGGLLNLNVHFHLVVPDGVFVEDGEGLRFEMLPVPTNANVLAILDRVMRRIARRLAKDAAVCSLDENAVPDVLAQVQAEAASTWRTPSGASAPVRGAERLRAWCEGFSLHAGVVIAEHDRDALERLCRYGARAFALERLTWTVAVLRRVCDRAGVRRYSLGQRRRRGGLIHRERKDAWSPRSCPASRVRRSRKKDATQSGIESTTMSMTMFGASGRAKGPSAPSSLRRGQSAPTEQTAWADLQTWLGSPSFHK